MVVSGHRAVHLLGLSVLGGSLLVLDLGARRGAAQSIDCEPREGHRAWLLGSIAVMIVTGTALFVSESVKCYYSQAFWLKITALPPALLFTLTIRHRVGMGEPARHVEPGWSPSSADAVVHGAAAGRWIGFSSGLSSSVWSIKSQPPSSKLQRTPNDQLSPRSLLAFAWQLEVEVPWSLGFGAW